MVKKMTKKNSNYWSKRLANATWKTYNNTNKYHKELIKLYKKTTEEIMMELFKIEAKFAQDGVISRSDFYRANHLMRMEEGFKSILKDLGERVEVSGSKEILNAGKELIGATGDILKDIGIKLNYNPMLAKRMLQNPWKGATFSDRVWKNQNKLLNELNTSIKKGIMTGKSTAQMAMELSRTMDTKLYEASRLVRSETMHHLNEVNKASMKESGIEQVQEIVTLDERTSSQCSPHDGLIWDIDKAPELPRHPNCRCVLVAYIDVDHIQAENEIEDVQDNLFDRELPNIQYDTSIKGVNPLTGGFTLEPSEIDGRPGYKLNLTKRQSINWDDLTKETQDKISSFVYKNIGRPFNIKKGEYLIEEYTKGSREWQMAKEIEKVLGAKYKGTNWMMQNKVMWPIDFYEKDGKLLCSVGVGDIDKKITEESLKEVLNVIRERENKVLESMTKRGIDPKLLTVRKGDDWVTAMKEFHSIIGSDNKPKLISETEYELLDTPTLYRGIAPQSRLRKDITTVLNTQQMADEFFKSESSFPSRGIYGDGIAYAAPDFREIGVRYATNGGRILSGGKVINFKLDDKAKTIEYQDAVNLFNTISENIESGIIFSKSQKRTDAEVGKAMNLLGYDAIIEPNGDDTGIPFYVILNRGGLVSKDNYVSVTITPEFLKGMGL